MSKEFYKPKKGEKPVIRFLPHPKSLEPSLFKYRHFKGTPEDFFKKRRDVEIEMMRCPIIEFYLMREVKQILGEW
jgi:hypothetical protein